MSKPLFAMKTPPGQLDPSKLQYPTLVQPKLDGLRGICIKDSAKLSQPRGIRPSGTVAGVRWFSFTGKPLWNLENVSVNLPEGDTAVYDGEIIWPGHPFSDAYGLCKRQTQDEETLEQAAELEFHCFDRLELSEWSGKHCIRPFGDRLYRLHDFQAGVWSRPYFPMGVVMAIDAAELEAAYKDYLAEGHEGLMAKRPEGLYHWARHADWMRYKPTETADVTVIAAYEEQDKTGKFKGTLGGFFVRTEKGVVCKVGNGFKAVERKAWWKPKFAIVLPASLPRGKDLHYGGSPLIGKTIECEFKMWTKDGAMREPHFKRLRPDK